MDFIEQVDKAKELRDIALKEEGIWKAKIIRTCDIVTDHRVRYKCRHAGCRVYGKNFMCPPYAIDVEEFQKVLSGYYMAMIVQLKGKIKSEQNWEPESDAWALKLHDIIYRLEKKAFSLGFPFAAGLIGGNCKLCDPCFAAKGTGTSCRYPEKARPSLEALGGDVMATCVNVGMPLEFNSVEVLWTGFVLLA